MLQSYHETCSELLLDYEVEWNKDFAYFKGELDLAPKETESDSTQNFEILKATDIPPPQEKIEDEINESVEAPEWARKLYKKIVVATHPDKVAGDSMEAILVKKFLRAGEAYKAGKFGELVSIALELNLDAELSDESLVTTLEKRRLNLRDEITFIESSIAWVWCEHFGDIDMKSRLLASRLPQPMNIDELKSMILERERLANDAG
jgi:hypothetical protein